MAAVAGPSTERDTDMEDQELPPEVEDLLLVGRKCEMKDKRGSVLKRGVVRSWRTVFGAGKTREGDLCCQYDPPPGKTEGAPMPVEIQYHVCWEGQPELELLPLEDVQKVATKAFTAEEWLPLAMRKLLSGGPGGGFNWGLWDTLDGTTVVKFLQEAGKEAQKAPGRAKKATATRTSPRKAGKAAAAPKAAVKQGPTVAPMRQSNAMLTGLAAKRAALAAKKAAAAGKAGGSGGASLASPKPSSASKLKGALEPARRGSGVAAAAAARVVTSGSPPSGSGRQQQRQAQREPLSESVVVTSSAGNKRKSRQPQREQVQQVQQQQQEQREPGERPAKQAKQALLSPSKSARSGPSKSGLSKSARSSRLKPELPAALLQDAQPEVEPAASERLQDVECRREELPEAAHPDVHLFDRVTGADHKVYRAYSRSLIIAESLCKAPRDKSLAKWKMSEAGDEEYAVQELIAERKGEEGETQYLIKWVGFEADPGDDSWQYAEELGNCPLKLKAWQTTGRDSWLVSSKTLRYEAGVDEPRCHA